MLSDVKVGDKVIRHFAGVDLPLEVSDVTADLIICGGTAKAHIGWWFDKATGAEVDEDLGWGPPPKMTGSYITKA